ncbi:unnamed protein product [Allacma fusca]|uniref:DUF5641 domain-containing protein n=1 Tax=Allacma fusca TaxID=39272 RepID=A0A8J2KZW6_9HEXA|nr:unnamed protein product [Allacma fusca]
MESRPARSHASKASPLELWFPVESVSSLARLRWREAYCLRFIYNCRRPKSRRSGPLVAAELDDASLTIIKSVQQISFPSEISHLQLSQPISNKSPFLLLHPVLLNGIFRVGGRLQNSDLTQDQVHPVILPQSHHLTHLIIIDAHVRNLHSGPQALVAYLHRRFWILNCRDVVRKIIHPDMTDIKVNRLSRWQLCQQLTQHFWQRWKDEFLALQQQRQKWNSQSENLKVGTLVLLKDKRLLPVQWKLARILELHPGKDSLVRAVTIETSEGLYKRPIVKLCPLPMDAS